MAEKIENHDFIELNYTGMLENGTVFDTTEKEVAQKNNLPTDKSKFKPAIICLGEKQIIPGLDAQLINKEIGKEYTIDLEAEEAFGKRDIKKIKIVPLSTFKEHNVQPQPGLQIDVDGEMGIVSRAAGGRVIVNFNHPLAGKKVTYQVTVLRKITDQKEQISSFLNTALRIPLSQLKIEIKENKAKVELPLQLPPQFTEAISKKLAELVKLEAIEFKAVVPKKNN